MLCWGGEWTSQSSFYKVIGSLGIVSFTNKMSIFHIYPFFHLSCVENLVGIYSNHMVFRQNLSPLFREPSLFFRGDEFYKNLFRELSRRTVPFEEEIFTIWRRKNLPIECAQGDRPARCPSHFFAVNEPSAVPWWWCDLFWCHEVACGVRWSNLLRCEVTWGELLWLVATWGLV